LKGDFAEELARARAAGPEALQALAEKHLPLVGALVRRFSASIPREELYQEGVVGLMKALQRFDPSRGTTFATFAVPLILGEMRMCSRRNAPLHIPRRETALRQRIRHTQDMLSAALQREPTITELADAMHMDAAELSLHLEDISVSSTDHQTTACLLPDPEDWQRRVELRDILSRLPRLDRQLILLRHHLGLTQTQAGQRLGLTQMQVSRREATIRTLLRRALAE